MEKRYLVRQGILVISQAGAVVILCRMAVDGSQSGLANTFPLILISLLFLDAAYLSLKNLNNSRIFTQFSCLLLLAAWQFLFSLFGRDGILHGIFYLLIPITVLQTIDFLQTFLFQDSSYRGQKSFLFLLRITCCCSAAAYFLSMQAFSLALLLQSAAALGAGTTLMLMHRKRILFFLKSQKKVLIRSFLFVVLPFTCYILVFIDRARYLENMGSYFIIMTSFVSVHSIVNGRGADAPIYFALRGREAVLILCLAAGTSGMVGYLTGLGTVGAVMVFHVLSLLAQCFQILLYHRTVCRGVGNYYGYSLSQLKREERLREDFSNYLHDEILQDLLSIKNLAGKAERPEIKKLIAETADGLNRSIRARMESYRPTLLRSLTLKENMQNMLDTLSADYGEKVGKIDFICEENIFLVEPYNVMVYRILRELVTNALKHAQAAEVIAELSQQKGKILLEVTDNGTGFEQEEYRHQSHRGLNSILEQVSMLGGTMQIRSGKGAGTRITIAMEMKGEDSYQSFIGG